MAYTPWLRRKAGLIDTSHCHIIITVSQADVLVICMFNVYLFNKRSAQYH